MALYRRRSARRAPKRAPRRARAPRRGRKASGMGHLILKRKAELAYVRNSAVAGVAVTTGVVSSMITLGTPEAVTVFNGNYSNVPFTCQFSLDQIIASSEITNLADRYKIKSVSLKWRYNADQYTSPVALTLNANQPVINWITDHDDSGVQTVSALRQKMGLKRKVFNANREVSLSVSPRVSPAVFNGLTTAYSIPSKSMFINSAYNTVPHYGIKGYLEGMCLETTANVNSVFTVDATFVIEARDFQ